MLKKQQKVKRWATEDICNIYNILIICTKSLKEKDKQLKSKMYKIYEQLTIVEESERGNKYMKRWITALIIYES